jgi:hypothetical protein
MSWSQEEYQEMRYKMRRYVKTYYDIQRLNTLISNRVGLKKDRSEINRDGIMFQDEWALYEAVLDDLGRLMEENVKKVDKEKSLSFHLKIITELGEWPVYTEWLAGVKGVGHLMSGVMCAEFDIYKWEYISKGWQYAGMNPGMVRGMKFVKTSKPDSYVPKEGNVVRHMKNGVVVRTFDLVRGDRLTPGYLAPFNQFLRTKLVGVLAPSFLKCQSPYSQHYYRLHVPIDRRDEMGAGRLDVEEGWKDKSEGHRSNYARRIMIKEFLKDLYVAWRTLEGLPVREPYAEEYLGKTHHDDDPESVAV